ncbi:MAG: cytochrome c [Rhizobiaceae bacterium]|nr:cytochrome c [Rhizobiaceae bacterium]MCV0405530.1 cytochrome c [Rhizobiaceae bacterium]
MMRKVLAAIILPAIAAGAGFWFASAPDRLSADEAAALEGGDAARGEEVFFAGGCVSCHARPGAEGDAALELAGGLELDTDFGVFVAPNISQHPQDGIGGWSAADFGNAMLKGVSPSGAHYYPAFPYTSYARMEPGDVADLFAFMKTLPPVEGEAEGHRLAFPWSVRRGIGLWKRVNLDPSPVVAVEHGDEAVARGRYLVEGPGHCGECHTPRDWTGGTDRSRWLAGAPAAEGDGRVPNITPGGIGSWSASDIAYFLESGFTPEFDSAGGRMAAVVRNMARLPAEDREAIAAYLKAVPEGRE